MDWNKKSRHGHQSQEKGHHIKKKVGAVALNMQMKDILFFIKILNCFSENLRKNDLKINRIIEFFK